MTRNGRTVPRCMTAAQCQRGFTGPPPAGDSHLQASIPEPVEATRWGLPSITYALTQPLLALATAGMATLFSDPQPGASTATTTESVRWNDIYLFTLLGFGSIRLPSAAQLDAWLAHCRYNHYINVLSAWWDGYSLDVSAWLP